MPGYATLGYRLPVRRFESMLLLLELCRETVFLEHLLVPKSTRNSVSQPYVISGPIRNQTIGVRALKPEERRVSENDTRRWFYSEPAQVLYFHSLYDTIHCDSADLEYRNKVTEGIVPSNDVQRV